MPYVFSNKRWATDLDILQQSTQEPENQGSQRISQRIMQKI